MPLKRTHLLKIAAVVLIMAFALGWIVYGLAQPVSSRQADPVYLTVSPGMTANDIGTRLYEYGLVKSVLLFRLVAKIEGLENSLQAGEYAFSAHMSVQQIVRMLANGEVAYSTLTIPEGYTVDQIAQLIESKKLGKAEKFKAAAKEYGGFDYMVAKPGIINRSEGFIFPDTYRIASGTTEEQMLKVMVENFDRKFTPQMRERAAEMGLEIHDVVTLASLVEKEAKMDNERPVIASVFMKRVESGMPLQSCATIQYILGYAKPELTLKDTQIESSYNTYLNMGLPPGPIANPGLAAINAVLHPAEKDYLYFVADSSGAHRFSRTYDEHLAAIKQVQGQ